jgi:hypothetical protein
MNLADVMDEVGDLLDQIIGLRVYRYPPDNVAVPAAVVDLPESYAYDETCGRGMDRLSLPVAVLIGKVSDRASRDAIAPYFDGSGSQSVKTVVEAGTPYDSFDTVRVTAADDPFEVWTFGGVSYLAGRFLLDIAGPGGS